MLLDLIVDLAVEAGAERYHPRKTIKAAIAHLLMGELSRLALGNKANLYWGEGDAIWPLTAGFFRTNQ